MMTFSRELQHCSRPCSLGLRGASIGVAILSFNLHVYHGHYMMAWLLACKWVLLRRGPHGSGPYSLHAFLSGGA